MWIQRIAIKSNLPCVKNAGYRVQSLATQAKAKTDLMTDVKSHFTPALSKKPKREPFAKNLFLGVIDNEFFAYPEPQHVDRYNEFQQWIKPIQDYMKTVDPKEFEDTDSIPVHVLQNFRELGLFGLRIKEDYKGLNLLNSEYMQVLESVSSIPALGLFFLKQGVCPIDIFNKYASVTQKLKYLPTIAAGQSLATIAVTENNAGPVISVMEMDAVMSDCGNYWILKGEKNFVANSNLSDIFIVYAHAMQSSELVKRLENNTSFIVEKEYEGVTVADSIKTIGLKGYQTSKVIFNNVKVPKENVIGKIGSGSTQLIDMFTNSKHFIGPLTISLLKNFLNLLTKDVLPRKHFDQALFETQYSQNIFSNIICSIYAMESALYLTTAMMDIYDGQDIELETAIVEQYCVQECLQRLQESMWLVGSKASILVQPFEQILRDAFTVTNYETSLIETKSYSAILGLQHYGSVLAKEIKKKRNPLMFPKEIFKRLFESEKLNLHIYEHLHPSLQECSKFCDRIIYKLKKTTETLLIREGTEVNDHHVHIHKLSDIVSLIYVYIAILSRSSRSYCIGHRDSENEIKISIISAYKLQQKIFQLAEDITFGEYANGDYHGREISKLHFERKSYSLAHPLERNY